MASTTTRKPRPTTRSLERPPTATLGLELPTELTGHPTAVIEEEVDLQPSPPTTGDTFTRDHPPHLSLPDIPRLPEEPHRSPPPDGTSLERILDRQQRQITQALADQQRLNAQSLAEQQRLMMTSFQNMLGNVLATQAARPPAANTAASLSSKMRLSDPDPFDGSPKHTESFINSCVNIFMAQPLLYANAESQIRFALSFFKAGTSAIRWRDGLLRDIKTGHYVITDWEDFEDHLRQSFGNPHRAHEARRALHLITQGNRTAEDFFIAFEELKADAGFCDAAIIFQLHRALHQDVREELDRRHPKPTEYLEFKDAILQIDQDLRESNAAGTFFNPNARQRRFNPAYAFRPNFSSISRPQAPTLNTTTATALPKAPTPTAAPITNPPTSNPNITCWKCGSPGHIGRNCTTTPQKPGKLTRQLLEKGDELDLAMDHVRQLLEEANNLPDDVDEDHAMFVRFMDERPQFFVESDE